MTSRIREAADSYGRTVWNIDLACRSEFTQTKDDFQAGAEWMLAEVLKELRGPRASNRCREQDVKQYHYHSTDWADWIESRFKGE